MINVLPKHIAELISAGEVVERPVSVIKELVENSLDAKATHITVEIRNGGKTYMRVTDDGIGISQEDVPKAFIRFATSKITTKDDLDKIMTLGFRGEALASVSAVARVEVFTKTKGENLGTHYQIQGSEETLNEKTGCPDGTTIVVRDLFYNVPVRSKFLKRDVVESNTISTIMKKLAVSHPKVAFTFIRDGKNEFSTFGDNDQYSTVYSIYGKTFVNELIPVDYVEGNVSVSGYTVKPLYAKANRQYQIFFVNGRAVRSEMLSRALEEAYETTVMNGKFPVCILKLEMPPETLDVNIHPTKSEVRFSNENEVLNAVFFSVKDALNLSGLMYDFDLNKTKNARSNVSQKATPLEKYVQPNLPNVDLPNENEVVNEEKDPFIFKSDDQPKGFSHKTEPKQPLNEPTFDYNVAEPNIVPFSKPEPITIPSPIAPKAEEPTPTPIPKEPTRNLQHNGFKPKETTKPLDNHIGVLTRPSFYQKKSPKDIHVKLIGEAFKNYILVEYEGDIVIIDKHAGHERIVYEKLKSQSAYNDRQTLLVPIDVLLSDEQMVALETNPELVTSLGFKFEFKNKPYVSVVTVPEILKLDDIEYAVTEIADNIIANKKQPQTKLIDDIVHSLACKSAIRSQDKTTPEEMVSLAKQILSNEKVRHCPHGRPVMFVMSKSDLEKQFKRVQ